MQLIVQVYLILLKILELNASPPRHPDRGMEYIDFGQMRHAICYCLLSVFLSNAPYRTFVPCTMATTGALSSPFCTARCYFNNLKSCLWLKLLLKPSALSFINIGVFNFGNLWTKRAQPVARYKIGVWTGTLEARGGKLAANHCITIMTISQRSELMWTWGTFFGFVDG